MSVHLPASLADWAPPTLGELLRWPIPERKFIDRCLMRGLTLLARSQINTVFGLEHVGPANDPFIVALNHATRREALLVPAILMLYRGRAVHSFYGGLELPPGPRARADLSARPDHHGYPQIGEAAHPQSPEANLSERTADGDRADTGAAAVRHAGGHLPRRPGEQRPRSPAAGSNRRGLPVVGNRSTGHSGGHPLAGRGAWLCGAPRPIEIRIGTPLMPPRPLSGRAAIGDLRAWHAEIMGEIGRLSGKAWVRQDGGQNDRRQPRDRAPRRAGE